MAISDLHHFDEDAYAIHVSNLSDREIQQRLRRKDRQKAGKTASIALQAGYTLTTAGLAAPVTIPVAALNARQLSIASQKKDYLVDEARRRPHLSYRRRKRDTFVGMMTTFAVFGTALGVEEVLSEGVGHVLGGVGEVMSGVMNGGYDGGVDIPLPTDTPEEGMKAEQIIAKGGGHIVLEEVGEHVTKPSAERPVKSDKMLLESSGGAPWTSSRKPGD